MQNATLIKRQDTVCDMKGELQSRQVTLGISKTKQCAQLNLKTIQNSY